MAVGEFIFPEMPVVEGLRFGVAKAGVKPESNRLDLALIEIAEEASVAGVFTQNAFCAEPVKICRENLKKSPARYFVINSGNANACTGAQGREAAIHVCNTLAKESGVTIESVLPFSTGVIGEVLPAERIAAAIPEAFNSLSKENWLGAAQAIMTTDTRPKGAFEKITLHGKEVTIAGIAKGAGMIKPNMGTMLAYIATDAVIEQSLLEDMCRIAANKSFNRITIDGDTSTNDAFMLVATGKNSLETISSRSSAGYKELLEAIIRVAQTLAQEMVKDGEGASKFLTVNVSGGASQQDCLDVAYAICHSPLVKTALFASDPNWGRIVAAIGYAGVENLNADKLTVHLDDLLIVENGGRAESYSEEQGQAIFSKPEFSISVDLKMGECKETLWTSDLSQEYVKINAEYRT